MQTAAEVTRHYSEPDAAMRQRMRTMYEHFITRQAAFQAFNPDFDVDFGPEWLAALNTADTTPDHAVRVGELKEDTAEVATVMTQAQRAIQTVFYYVGQAFPGNTGRLDTYGRRSYVAARDNHDKMRTLLQTAFASATRDHLALAGKGYDAPKLTALGDLVGALTETNTTQEVQKGLNTEASDHCITVQNLAYGFGQEASAAAKVLFADDAATLDLFRLGPAAASGPEHHELTVAADTFKTLDFSTPLPATTALHLRLAEPQFGQQAIVGRVEVAGSPPAVFVTLTPGLSEMDVLAPTLGLEGQVLAVYNQGEGPVHIEISVLPA